LSIIAIIFLSLVSYLPQILSNWWDNGYCQERSWTRMLDLLCAINTTMQWYPYAESWRNTTSQSKRMLKVKTHKPCKNHTTANYLIFWKKDNNNNNNNKSILLGVQWWVHKNISICTLVLRPLPSCIFSTRWKYFGLIGNALLYLFSGYI